MKDYWWEPFGDFLIMRILMPLLLLSIAVIVFVVAPYAIYSGYTDSKRPTFSLVKDEWSCIQEHVYTTTTMVMAGKVMVPVTTTHHDCINYIHK